MLCSLTVLLIFVTPNTISMKTFLRILKWIGIVVVVLVISLVGFILLRKDRTYDAPFPDVKASTDSSVIARGKYLVNGPAHCMHCHTPNDQMAKVDAGEIVPMIGGHEFKFGPVATMYSPNLTADKETGIGAYTDGEIARVLRYGVKRDGTPLFDIMPFYDISESDLTAIVSYLRTLEPVKNKVPEGSRSFLGDALYAFGAIAPVGLKTEGREPILKTVNPDSSVAYGKYLAHYVGNCVGCHTDRNLETGEFTGQPFAGGLKLPCETDPNIILVTPNITIDKETGRLANYTEESFIKRFRQGRLVKESMMPWGPYSRMSDMELKALYRYLQTVKPIKRDNGPVIVKTAELK